MVDKAAKKSSKKRLSKTRLHETVAGVSRFLYAMNLMLEAASAQSRHSLTRYETLLLSIFRNGIVSRKRVEEEFRKLLLIQPENRPAETQMNEAFEGLIAKGLIRTTKRSVEITEAGRGELQRLSDIVDSVYDQLVDRLPTPERDELLDLMKRIGSQENARGE